MAVTRYRNLIWSLVAISRRLVTLVHDEVSEQSGQEAGEQRERGRARERHCNRLAGAGQLAHLTGRDERATRHLLLARVVGRLDEHVAAGEGSAAF